MWSYNPLLKSLMYLKIDKSILKTFLRPHIARSINSGLLVPIKDIETICEKLNLKVGEVITYTGKKTPLDYDKFITKKALKERYDEVRIKNLFKHYMKKGSKCDFSPTLEIVDERFAYRLDACKALRTSKDFFSTLKNGRQPLPETIMKMAKLFNVDPASLFINPKYPEDYVPYDPYEGMKKEEPKEESFSAEYVLEEVPEKDYTDLRLLYDASEVDFSPLMEIRKQMKLSQEDFSRAMGFYKNYLYNMKQKKPLFESVLKMADFLQCEPDSLYIIKSTKDIKPDFDTELAEVMKANWKFSAISDSVKSKIVDVADKYTCMQIAKTYNTPYMSVRNLVKKCRVYLNRPFIREDSFHRK